MQDLAAGGIDVVTCSVPEAKAMIDAGKVRSLAVMSAERNPAFPDVPTLREAGGIDFTVGAWRGIAGPKGLPEEVTAALVPALEKIHGMDEFKDFMNQRGFGMAYAPPEQFAQFMSERDAAFGEIMKGLGLTK